jgi:hypothetical protein
VRVIAQPRQPIEGTRRSGSGTPRAAAASIVRGWKCAVDDEDDREQLSSGQYGVFHVRQRFVLVTEMLTSAAFI